MRGGVRRGVRRSCKLGVRGGVVRGQGRSYKGSGEEYYYKVKVQFSLGS